MSRRRWNGFKIWTAALSLFVAVWLFPAIAGKHGAIRSAVLTALAVGAIWLMYLVVGRFINASVARALKRRDAESGGQDDHGKKSSIRVSTGPILVLIGASMLIGGADAGPPARTPGTAAIRQAAVPSDWPVVTPDEAGFDGQKLTVLAAEIRRQELLPHLHELLIVRHGRLVLEATFNSWKADRLHTLQSVTKSFASALVGIAIAHGEFKGVDEKVLDFFPDLTGIANMDERKKSMRLEDILTMRTGTDYDENGPGSPHFQLNVLTKGWDKFYLDRPMVRAPGTGFQYDSGGVILLSAMLKRRTGRHAGEYARDCLFKPLGIEKWFWIHNAEGHSHAGGGLNLTARDAAKFGQLYLQKGRWGDVQVVPEDWVRESFKMRVDFAQPGQPPSGYGYLWWLWAPDPRGKSGEGIYAARGHGGQYIIVVPEYDMVVVFLGDAKDRAEMAKPIEVFYDRVLTALIR
jgi:CubicO group peptidase (beta-lactamase class C family)